MQTERPLTKADRHRLVGSLVERMGLGTQQELLDALQSAGCIVPQARVSRDIRELGLEKACDPLGHPRYVLPNRGRRIDPRDTLNSLLAQFGRGAVAAQNVVVVQAEIGSAPAIARWRQRVQHRLVVGTLAGDATCLVIATAAKSARELAAEL